MKNPIIFETAYAQYTSSKIIGEGGDGRVYEASDAAGERYAIKVLSPEKTTTEKQSGQLLLK